MRLTSMQKNCMKADIGLLRWSWNCRRWKKLCWNMVQWGRCCTLEIHRNLFLIQISNICNGCLFIIWCDTYYLKLPRLSGQSAEVRSIKESRWVRKAGFYLEAPWLVRTWTSVTPVNKSNKQRTRHEPNFPKGWTVYNHTIPRRYIFWHWICFSSAWIK